MAVYQYYLAVIPKEGIKKKHDFIPSKIRVSSETGYFESDAALYWNEVEWIPDEIVLKIDRLIKRAEWGNHATSYNWKAYTAEVDNDVSIYFDEATKAIIEFYFRADLRETDLVFLKNVIALGKENNWLFMDRKGKLMEPDLQEIMRSISASDAHTFLFDPMKFLKDIVDRDK